MRQLWKLDSDISANLRTWNSQLSAAWWKSSVRLLARLGKKKPTQLLMLRKLLSTEAAAGCGRRSGWKHKERKQERQGRIRNSNFREKPQRSESICECVCLLSCTQQNNESDEYHMFFSFMLSGKMWSFIKKKLNEGNIRPDWCVWNAR